MNILKRKVWPVIRWVIDWTANIFLGAVGLFVLWFVAQLFFYATFTVPTESMEPTIHPGDRVMVDKTMMGARLFDVFAAASGEQVDIHRVPGWRNMERGDVIVFNFPYAGEWDSIAMHPSIFYLKRCIALPGDTVEIRDCVYHINGMPSEVSNRDSERILHDLIRDNAETNPDYLKEHLVMRAFPNNSSVPWTVQNFGPMAIPCARMKMKLTPHTATVYRNYIEWERGLKLTVDSTGTVRLGMETVTEYEFTRDYVFVAGDRVFNSQDSRYFGLVPMPFIVGRAVWKISH